MQDSVLDFSLILISELKVAKFNVDFHLQSYYERQVIIVSNFLKVFLIFILL